MLYLTPITAMLYLTPIFALFDTDTCHAIIDTNNCHAIFDTDICHAVLDLWHLTPVLGIYTGTQYLHRHLACYTWYNIYDSGTRYLHWHSIYRPGTWYVTCTWHMVYDMLSCGTNTWTWHHDSWPDTTTPDACIIWQIHDYHFYGDLAWLLYYYQIFGTSELLYSCILEPLK